MNMQCVFLLVIGVLATALSFSVPAMRQRSGVVSGSRCFYMIKVWTEL